MTEVEQEQQEEAPSPEEILEADADRREREQARTERGLHHIAEILVAMSRTEAWQLLAQTLKDEETKTHARHLQQLLDGAPLDQRDIDKSRGRIEGLKVPLTIIARAEEVLAQRDAGEPEPENDPYAERSYWD